MFTMEPQYDPLLYFNLDGSGYSIHTAQEAAIAGYVRWHGKRTRPKGQCATDSKFRHPDSYQRCLTSH